VLAEFYGLELRQEFGALAHLLVLAGGSGFLGGRWPSSGWVLGTLFG